MVYLHCSTHGYVTPLHNNSQHQTVHQKLQLIYQEVAVRKIGPSPLCLDVSNLDVWLVFCFLTTSLSSFTFLFYLLHTHPLTLTRRKRDVTAVNSNVYILFGEAWFSLEAAVDWFCGKEKVGPDSAESLGWIKAVGSSVNSALMIHNRWGSLLN